MNRFLCLLVPALLVGTVSAQKHAGLARPFSRPVALPGRAGVDGAMRLQVEADWLLQSQAWRTNALAPAAVQHFAEGTRRLAESLRPAIDDAAALREVSAVEALLRDKPSMEPAELTNAYLKLRWTMRRLAFSNPALGFDRILFVKRFCQETYPDVCLNHMPWVSRPGGDICILTRRGPGEAPLISDLLRGRLGPGHVHGVDLSWDGKRIVFGYAKAKSASPPEGWLDRRQSYRLRLSEEPIHLYEMDVDASRLRQLTRGEWSDLDPTYAANGDIVFVSERCGTSLQCNEFDKDETSCNLYVIRPDGSGIRRLSANKDGDYLPHTLDDGTVGYTRWEYHERSWAFIQSLWTIRPDGTQADAIFKQHFVNPWSMEDVRSIPGTHNQQLVCVAAGHHTLAAGPVLLVKPGAGINDPRGIQVVTPGVLPPEGGMDGTPVPEGGVRDRGGYYMHPWALTDKTFLASYSFGRGRTGVGSEIDPAGYALYLIDVFGTKELIYRDPGISCFTPIPLQARTRPAALPPLFASSAAWATCIVSTVSYGCDGISPDSIRFIRIAEPVGWPYDNRAGGQRYGEDHGYGGPGAERKNLTSWTPLRILGDVPVERDGSAHFRVPADRAVYFQLLDANRMEMRRMRSFISFQPGEQRGCTGCHESRGVAPVPAERATSIAMSRPPSLPDPPPWGDQPISFLRDVQPVLDRHCVRCHSGLKPAGGIDLSPGLVAYDPRIPGYGHNRAFETILASNLVSISAVRAQDAAVTPPLAYGARRSRLIACLVDAVHGRQVALSPEDRLRLVMWVDANAPYHDEFINKRSGSPAYDLAADQDLVRKLAAIHERRCAGCHDAKSVTRLDWIDLRNPTATLFLAAPLGRAGDTGRHCSPPAYAGPADADYLAARELVEAAVAKTWSNPRRDLLTLTRR